MQKEKLGIKNLKTVTVAVLEIVKAIKKIIADRKFNFKDLRPVWSIIDSLGYLASSLPYLKKEILDLSESEKDELIQFLRVRFNKTQSQTLSLLEDLMELSLLIDTARKKVLVIIKKNNFN